MFTKLSNSWNLMKASWAVLREDKELIIFPILSTVAVILVTISFAVPMFFAGFFDKGVLNDSGILKYVVGFVFYFVQYTIIIFSNTALVGAAMIRLRGGNPTVSDGFKIAFGHITTILGYAFISATVGLILRSISERSGIFGKIVVSILSFAWNLATFLVIPVLVVENIGPIDAIKRSTSLLKKTWGEQIAGNLSIGLVTGFITLALVITMVLTMVALAEVLTTGMLIFVISLFVLSFILLALISSTLSSIYEAAVYIYAAEGKTTGFFEERLVSEAFRLK
ncbi:MAG: hypothetical protein A2499_16510 [Stygiobacter sp. RIFOXYC12_FULL_38_8]|nr:MAG: hypothetical protein A2X62_05405 [Stygiobacter sp. GWC2_38_9]OGU85897.1 MAG: hypothetical protein A2279_09635 [Stygiobacter sp. RIFOXYA12_FULL_38_9]OGV08616.1 MAG: hypothetical protein A2299_17255 [Stygiobacter sp. RIFOXYB2_FULL_37_11]OGV11843.1 MAG: hypothetical protein A2237_07315 [Stygiobacter sp. RIFOXYA2_FULL_38_8]OGV12496.1 MAG: hypothetical protein A2440_14680 [Stygiobacter sp. RIFOXYC2_FULL_38_25]OGV24126.1 MAG: hypothetical protein A2499_16510 [Stygiobacter sp. RIFOXYC12_FULL_